LPREDVAGYSLIDSEEISFCDATSPAATRDGMDGWMGRGSHRRRRSDGDMIITLRVSLGDGARTRSEYRSLALQQVSHGTSCRASHCKGSNHGDGDGDGDDGDGDGDSEERKRGVLRARGKRSGDENTPSGARIARTRARHAIWVTRRDARRAIYSTPARDSRDSREYDLVRDDLDLGLPTMIRVHEYFRVLDVGHVTSNRTFHFLFILIPRQLLANHTTNTGRLIRE